jgi:putative transposase
VPEHGGSMAGVAESTNRFALSDEQWALFEPLIPKHKNTHRFGGGRPRKLDRVCMNAIFFVARTGCQWNALDATGICPSSTAHDRFQEWVKAGVFLMMWKAGLIEYDDLKGLDWAWLSMDGAMTKSPLSGKKMWPESHGSRQRRG